VFIFINHVAPQLYATCACMSSLKHQTHHSHTACYRYCCCAVVQELCLNLRRVFAPAETQIFNLIKLDAYPRFVAAINSVLEAFAAGKVLTLDDLEVGSSC
jgi:hypothetical protein